MKAILSTLLLMTSSLASELNLCKSVPLQNTLDAVVSNTISVFASSKLKSDDFAITLWDIWNPGRIQCAAYRGDVRIYPASVVKLFYLVAAHRWLEEGKIQESAELQRALHDMIVASSNDATHYVIDVLTGTTGGPELPPAEMEAWMERRNAINRYFAAERYKNINVNQKPWGDGPYGRERVFVGANYENRNALSTDSTARLICEIVLGHAVSSVRSSQMLALLNRDIAQETAKRGDETQAFIASALPLDAHLWSKAGWTSQTRHDAAYIELPNGRKLILVIFTVNHAAEREIIPRIVGDLLPHFGRD